jgi:hypothetical protein
MKSLPKSTCPFDNRLTMPLNINTHIHQAEPRVVIHSYVGNKSAMEKILVDATNIYDGFVYKARYLHLGY